MEKKLFIVEHSHRHGSSFYLVRSDKQTVDAVFDDVIAFLGDDYEADREDEDVVINEAQIEDL